MRLLNVDSFDFAEFREDNRPRYVIASHRWADGSETTFKDLLKKRNTDSIGYKKVEAFARYIRVHIPSIKWLWIDTCCINKDSAAELSEAINSMFQWYRDAELCLAYLADVETTEDRGNFETSQWFTRGWTLQELLAPRTVVFVTKSWQVIGYKGISACGSGWLSTRPNLGKEIARTTRIPDKILHDYEASLGLSVDDKLKWMEGRVTTRPEDMSYALYGILGVTIGANYGEKYEGARHRLLAAVRERDDIAARQAERFRKIIDWLSPPDPWTNHESARMRHEPQTGAWLLDCDQYQAWKSGSTRYLWIHGRPGCGKTVLCYTAIEDLRLHCKNVTNIGQAIFYFSFSDNSKQTYENLLRSLVVQLGWKGPGLSMLLQAYEKPEQRLPTLDELQTILLSSLSSYDAVFLHLDALDECPEGDEVRQNVLEGMEELLQRASNVRILATSRDVPDVRDLMEKLGAESISIAAQRVNTDILRYVSTQLSCDRKLSRLDLATKSLVEETLSQKADGMFRWVHCQLQELKKSKSTRPRSIRAALLALPRTLDETYERMLNNINEDDRSIALTLLRWLAYAQSPLSLGELAESSIIDPTGDSAADGDVDTENRGHWEDTLDILAGLITIEGADRGDIEDDDDALSDITNDSTGGFSRRIEKGTRVRLAHFSVKEYLESPRILASNARDFHLDPTREHGFLAQSCLVYLIHYSNSPQKTTTKRDLAAFPLLEYAAQSWFYHSSLQQDSSSTQEWSFLASEDYRRDWLHVHDPDSRWRKPFERRPESIGTALYYASLVGLEIAVKQILSTGADVNAQGGYYGNALYAASERGYEKVVQILVDAGADVNSQENYGGNALYAASKGGHEKVVQILVDAGADVNSQGKYGGNALYAASEGGHEKVVQILVDAGADAIPQGDYYGNALYAASETGHEKVVQILVDAGVDANSQGRYYGNALQAASERGHEKVVQILIDAGADVNTQGGYYGNAIQAASIRGHEKVVQILIDAGADVDTQVGSSGNALQAASIKGFEKVVQILVDAGADINAQGGYYGNTLQIASLRGHEKVVQILIDAGADVNAQRGYYGNALYAASERGHEKVVQILVDAGADVNAQGGIYSNALQVASIGGYEKVVQILIDAGADVNAQGRHYSNALQVASEGGHEKVVQILIDAGADVNSQGEYYGNALWAASMRGYEKVV